MAADGKDTDKVPVTEILEEDDEFEVRRGRKSLLLSDSPERAMHPCM